MPKYTSPGYKAEMEKEANRPIELYILYLEAETLYLTSFPEEVEFWNHSGTARQDYTPYGIDRRRVNSYMTGQYDEVQVRFDNVLREMSSYVGHKLLVGRRVEVWKVFRDRLDNYEDRIVVFDGTIDRPRLDQETLTFSVISKAVVLESQVPRRLFEYNCPWVFGDDACGVAVEEESGTIDSVSGDWLTLYSTAITEGEDHWRFGEIVIGTQNRYIRASDTGEVEIDFPFYADVTGDSFTVSAGCSKIYGDNTFGCGRWNNRDYFGGFRSVPKEVLRV